MFAAVWKNFKYELVKYHFFHIKSENMLHWIRYAIIVRCIFKSSEIMLPNKISCSFSHSSTIEFIHIMISKMALERVHDGITVNLVMINLTFYRKPSMKFSWCRADLSNSYIRRKKTVQSSVNAIQIVVIKWCKKMCNLQSQ